MDFKQFFISSKPNKVNIILPISRIKPNSLIVIINGITCIIKSWIMMLMLVHLRRSQQEIEYLYKRAPKSDDIAQNGYYLNWPANSPPASCRLRWIKSSLLFAGLGLLAEALAWASGEVGILSNIVHLNAIITNR